MKATSSPSRSGSPLPRFLSRIASTSAGERLTSLSLVFSDADAATAAFARASGFRCPPGCGACCDRFVPDVTVAEAELVAALLVAENRALPPSAEDGGCPLRAAGPAGRCGVYEARPLVCRLFGFAGVRGGEGTVEFAKCRLMPAEPSPSNPVAPPAMSDFGWRVAGIDPGVPRASLAELLPLARARLVRLAELAAAPDDDDNDGGNDGSPPTRASA